MIAVVQVTSGPAAGKKTAMVAGQRLQVGRCSPADLIVGSDESLAPVHFVLAGDGEGFALAETPGPGGTFVNGQAVYEPVRLRHGDAIYAGRTLFKVQLESHVGSATTEREPTATKMTRAVAFTAEKCDSGLNLCRGEVRDISPGELAQRLAGRHALYLILDLNKLGRPVPEGVTDPQYLFDWLDPAVAPLASPMILTADQVPAWRELVDEAWGNDAVVCLFSKQPPTELLQRLRQRSRAKQGPNGMGGAVLGWCWPSVLAPLLAHHTSQAVRELLEGIEAVLVELPDLPETWQIYGPNGVAADLSALGLVDKTPQSGAESEPAKKGRS